jgi:hypothetical protein
LFHLSCNLQGPRVFRLIAAGAKLVLFASWALSAPHANAGTIEVTGTLSQVTVIRPIPAFRTAPGSVVAMPSPGDPYSLDLVFDGDITDAGNYRFDQMSLTFTAGSSFSMQSDFAETDLSITISGQDAIFSLFACSTGSIPCIDGHRLDLDFSVPADSFTGETSKVSTVSDFAPFDLLLHETPPVDYIGSIDHFAYSSAPEPASILLAAGSMILLLVRLWRRHSTAD